MKFFLVIQDGPQSGQRFELHPGSNSIGRGRGNDVTLRDEEVSREHASVGISDQRVQLKDLGSSNGTFVDSKRVIAETLEPGGCFQVGKTVLQLITLDPESQEDDGKLAGQTLKSRNRVEFDDPLAVSNDPGSIAARSQLPDIDFLRSAPSSLRSDPAFGQELLRYLMQCVPAERAAILTRNEAGGFDPGEPVFSQRVQSHRFIVIQSVVNFVTSSGEGVITQVESEGIERQIMGVPIFASEELIGIVYLDRELEKGTSGAAESSTAFRKGDLVLVHSLLRLMGTSSARSRTEAPTDHHADIGLAFKTLSHHIKNLLQGINGGAYLIDRGLEMSMLDSVQNGWEIVGNYQGRLSHFVQDCIVLSRPVGLKIRVCEIDEVLEAAVKKILPMARESKTDILLNAVENAQSLMADQQMVEMAVRSLLGTAIANKSDSSKGTLEVAVQFTKTECQVELLDDFQTPAPFALEDYFLPLTYESEETVRGLGPAVAAHIIQAHGGSLTASINKPEPGMRIQVTLPLNAEAI